MIEWVTTNASAVQAIASAAMVLTSAVGIAIAIWVPHRLHRRETRQRDEEIRREGQGIALMIEPMLVTLDGHLEANGIIRPEGVARIEIPETLLSMADDLWKLGHAGEHVLHLIGTIHDHNHFLSTQVSLPIDLEGEESRRFGEVFHQRINTARANIRDARAAIDELLGRWPRLAGPPRRGPQPQDEIPG